MLYEVITLLDHRRRNHSWHECRAKNAFFMLVLDSSGRYRFSGVQVGIDDPAAHGIKPYIRESKEVV